jgi:hypothetical protein
LAARVCKKAFFFEKKKQKTFAYLAAALPDRARPICKSFLVLFFKKEPLASMIQAARLCRRNSSVTAGAGMGSE